MSEYKETKDVKGKEINRVGHFMNWSNNKVIDVSGGKDEEGRPVIVWKKHNGNNQKWRVVYVDEHEGHQKEGLNTEFNMHCSRPFYLRSRMPMKRIAEAHGNSNVWLRRWRKNTNAQMWYFDCKDKTIHNNHWKNYALEIQSNGGSTNVRMTPGINSRWW
jgi:hypothetical protein